MKISFITASFNYAKYISETIESVINQTYEDWELIIVDDGSKDNSIEIINSYVNKYPEKIRLLTHPNNENRGLKETVKLGVKNATGDFVAFVESDDYIRKDYLEKKLEILKKFPDIKFIYNDVEMVGDLSGADVKTDTLDIVRKVFEGKDYPVSLCNFMPITNLVPTFSCVMVERKVLSKCNFNTPQNAWLDWWLWGQIAVDNKFYFIKEKLSYWRLHNESYINVTKDEVNKKALMFKRKLLGFYWLKHPFYCFLVQVINTERGEKIFRGAKRKYFENFFSYLEKKKDDETEKNIENV